MSSDVEGEHSNRYTTEPSLPWFGECYSYFSITNKIESCNCYYRKSLQKPWYPQNLYCDPRPFEIINTTLSCQNGGLVLHCIFDFIFTVDGGSLEVWLLLCRIWCGWYPVFHQSIPQWGNEFTTQTKEVVCGQYSILASYNSRFIITLSMFNMWYFRYGCKFWLSVRPSGYDIYGIATFKCIQK